MTRRTIKDKIEAITDGMEMLERNSIRNAIIYYHSMGYEVYEIPGKVNNDLPDEIDPIDVVDVRKVLGNG